MAEAYSDSNWVRLASNYATETKDIPENSPAYTQADLDATTGENKYELRRSIYHISATQICQTPTSAGLSVFQTTNNITPPTMLLPYNGYLSSSGGSDSVPTGTSWLWQVESFQISDNPGAGVATLTIQIKGTCKWEKRQITNYN